MCKECTVHLDAHRMDRVHDTGTPVQDFSRRVWVLLELPPEGQPGRQPLKVPLSLPPIGLKIGTKTRKIIPDPSLHPFWWSNFARLP